MLIYKCWQAGRPRGACRGCPAERGSAATVGSGRSVIVRFTSATRASCSSSARPGDAPQRRAQPPVCPLRAFGEPLGFAGCKACGHKVEPATASLRAAVGGLLQGFGLGCTQVPLKVIALSTLPGHILTQGTAIRSLLRHLGGS